MDTYTIGQVAERSGFSASALRYYEGIGLVPPARRSDAGYRLYDDRTLARLSFIARAKQLGCTLEEVTDLVEIWNGDRCGPVQRRMHGLVTGKLRDAEAQIAELGSFTGQLRSAASQLSGDPIDGPCDDGCACFQVRRSNSVTAIADADRSEPPIACTLEGAAVRERLAQWADVLGLSRRRVTLPSGVVRVEFADSIDVAELARLVSAEQHCCAFFRFAITVDTRGVGLEVDAPTDALDLVAGMFGESGSPDEPSPRLDRVN